MQPAAIPGVGAAVMHRGRPHSLALLARQPRLSTLLAFGYQASAARALRCLIVALQRVIAGDGEGVGRVKPRETGGIRKAEELHSMQARPLNLRTCFPPWHTWMSLTCWQAHVFSAHSMPALHWDASQQASPVSAVALGTHSPVLWQVW